VNNLAILPLSNCASESVDEVNASRTLLHRAVRQPVREHGTYGDEGKAVGCVSPTALLFVVHELEALVGPVHFDLDL
jgi:hypothetical protein